MARKKNARPATAAATAPLAGEKAPNATNHKKTATETNFKTSQASDSQEKSVSPSIRMPAKSSSGPGCKENAAVTNGEGAHSNGSKDKSASPSASKSPKSPKKRSIPDSDDEDELIGPNPAPKKTKASPTPPESPSNEAGDGSSPPGFQTGEDAATQLDKESWPGWCEIESDPAYFSAMTRELGIKDVSVKQAFTLDIDELKQLPQPIHGLIFLFRFREDTANSPLLEDERKCAEKIWFANQMPAQNSCGTLAMTNILMNAADVELGENLSEFKKFTKDFDSVDRGAAFGSFDFVRKIHNSFAKKMDMLEADVHMSEKVERAKQKWKNRRESKDSTNSNDSIEENAHHFIAFVPIDGKVWKLDGLDAHPSCLGAYDESKPDQWLEMACTRIMGLMTAYEAEQDYSLLALVQSPLVSLRNDYCKTVQKKKVVEKRLNNINTDWRSFAATADNCEPPSPLFLSSLGITEAQMASAHVPSDEEKSINAADMGDLLEDWEVLTAAQASLPDRIFMEAENEAAEDAKANERRFDTGPVIQLWLKMLAECGYLQEHLEEHMPKKK